MVTLNTNGGMLHYASQLSNALSKNNEITVIAPIGAEESLFDTAVKLIMLPVGNGKKEFIKNTLIITKSVRFLRAIQKEQPDIIHIQSTYLWTSLFLPLLREYRIITTIHDVIPLKGTSWVVKLFDQKIGRNIHIIYSNCLIIHDKIAKKNLTRNFWYDLYKKSCYILPHGNYSLFTKYMKNIIKEEQSVLFFGRIMAYKGIEYLIKAEPLIKEKIPDVKIVIAGEGDFTSYQKLIRDNNFEILNKFIPDEEVAMLFLKSKIIVLPYTEASQTGIIPIAYSFKKPVIVTNVGGLPESVDDGKTGFVVPPKNEKALADAIIKLLKDVKLRKQMGENAYKKMKEELSWDMIAEKTIEVYKVVINEHKR